ncbi:hypothetical protein [Sphingomonas sp. 28-63-12]|uniref:hypothetical protein n=1 Tax=Sphingomonas sp. 28-63-12 TaxID=1970434 RepID=UPI000BCA42B9|nr:MAG: hypothetical protein B7Y47_02640 [Sphingomonas sp. 28-63-12]
MRRALMAGMAGMAGMLSLLAAASGAAPDPATLLAGRYYEQFPNALVTGETYTGEDIVEIVPVAPRTAYVRFALDFYNGHSCSLAGVATADGEALVYRAAAPLVEDEQTCMLRIERNGDELRWSDEGSCKAYCGARGSFLHGAIPYRSKRPIRYLAKLKGSSAYRDAITEWRTGKPVNP